MAELANLTENENGKTNTLLHCSAEFTAEVHSQLIVISLLNIFLSITALLGNTLILVALRKETSLQPPSKLLYRNLAITDLCVGIIVQPLGVVYWISVMNETWIICYYAVVTIYISACILCLASLITLTAISVDRLLALLLGFKYRQVVTQKRAYITVAVIWVLSIISPSSYEIYIFIIVSLCLVTLFFSYIKIFFTMRHYQIHVQSHGFEGQPRQAIPLNKVRYRKGVYSALWVQAALIICYLPHFIHEALTLQKRLTLSVYISGQFSVTLVFLNSSLNPLLYCWRIREVRQAVKDTLGHLFCSRN